MVSKRGYEGVVTRKIMAESGMSHHDEERGREENRPSIASRDPSDTVEGIPLGPGCWKV